RLDTRLFYPAPSRSPYDPEGHHDGERVQRTEVLEVLMKWKEVTDGSLDRRMTIVTYPEALVPMVVGREELQKNTLTIKRNEELPIDTLEEWLIEMKFSRVEFVYEPGQFSIRGGIVDVFSYGSDQPFRIELFGDTVESVRRFDPQDQLSVERLAEAVIVPDLHGDDNTSNQNFLAQLPEGSVIWLDDPQAISDAAKKQLTRLTEIFDRITEKEKEKHPAPQDLLANDNDLIKALLHYRKVQWTSRGSQADAITIDFAQKPQPSFAKDFQVLSGDLHNKQTAGFTNLIACSNAK